MLLVEGAMEPRVRLLSLQCPLDLQILTHVGSLGGRSSLQAFQKYVNPWNWISMAGKEEV